MYNSLSSLPKSCYKILEYLATDPNAEELWKMLKYADYDALKQPNLSTQEKLDMIWKKGPQAKYSVFMGKLIEDAMAESKCILKIYDYYIHASGLYSSVVVYAFDFLYGGQMELVDYNGTPVSRGDLFVHKILQCLNGVEIGGIGKLVFFDDQSRYDLAKTTIGDSKKFTGIQIFMSTEMGDTGRKDICDSYVY